ncbi:MAG TPA: hypothetical protein EYN66_09155, partial [Myxococcales bacterium]|nr:hypothetical protein [Myxococcales bacterium]
GGTPKYCDDQNPCTTDSCASESGCTYAAIAGSCDDGNPCTLADHCNDGKCISGNSVCPCTNDSMCSEWNDNNLCNGVVRCMGGVCKIDLTTVVQCLESENNECSKLGCNPATGECGVVNAPEGTACDDGVLCTATDTCSGGTCISGPGSCACVQDNDCLALDDGDLCNGLLHCVGGQCVANMNSPVSCPQATDPCSPGGCNPATGQCGSTALADGTSCDDGNSCTQGDSCQNGFCTGTGIICDDGNLCTDDLCDGAGKCTFVPNAAACDDGNQCTQIDLCSNGLCQGTNDTCSCNSQTDCDIMPNDACLGSLNCINNICTADPTTAIFCDPSGNSDCMANQCVGGQCMMQPINNG